MEAVLVRRGKIVVAEEEALELPDWLAMADDSLSMKLVKAMRMSDQMTPLFSG